MSFAKTSKRFGVSVNTLLLWSKKLEAKPTKSKPAIKIDRALLMEDIKKHLDAFNYERAIMVPKIKPLAKLVFSR